MKSWMICWIVSRLPHSFIRIHPKNEMRRANCESIGSICTAFFLNNGRGFEIDSMSRGSRCSMREEYDLRVSTWRTMSFLLDFRRCFRDFSFSSYVLRRCPSFSLRCPEGFWRVVPLERREKRCREHSGFTGTAGRVRSNDLPNIRGQLDGRFS